MAEIASFTRECNAELLLLLLLLLLSLANLTPKPQPAECTGNPAICSCHHSLERLYSPDAPRKTQMHGPCCVPRHCPLVCSPLACPCRW
jgi:hypothetical protein